MSDSIQINVADIELRLLAARGAFWAAQRTLFVADAHVGKEATFRRHSIPVPRGSTKGTLRRISVMLASTGADRLVVLGDLVHARSSLSADVRDTLETFFAEHADVRFTLVRGNHDAHVGQLPAGWPIEIVEPGVRIDRVALGHQPSTVPDGAQILLCGHLHPAIRIGTPEDRIRLPCFWLSDRRLIFPAVGEFTGAETIRPVGNDRTWIIAEDQIVENA